MHYDHLFFHGVDDHMVEFPKWQEAKMTRTDLSVTGK